MRLLYLAVAGAVGTLARYGLANAVQGLGGGVFPTGILVVNVLGSFVLGVVMALSVSRALISEDFRLVLAVGLCGGFTTMSSFSYQTMALLDEGHIAFAFLNIVSTVAVCLAAVWVGGVVGRMA